VQILLSTEILFITSIGLLLIPTKEKQEKTVHALMLSSLALTMGCTPQSQKDKSAVAAKEPFKGKINLDVRESVPD
jgi:hypothetical protein